MNPPDPKAGGPMAFDAFEPARFALGDTLRYAQRIRLIEMAPRGDLSSTGYVLANPGVEYLVLQPTPREELEVTLEPGTYSVEWFAVDDRQTEEREDVTVREVGPVSLKPPFEAGPSVLYLTAT